MLPILHDIAVGNPNVNQMNSVYIQKAEQKWDHPQHSFTTYAVDKESALGELQKIMNKQVSDWIETSKPILNLSMDESERIYQGFNKARKM